MKNTGSITLAGSNISSIVDTKGNGTIWTEVTDSRRPQYDATGFNGQPAIFYNVPSGQGDVLTSNFTQSVTHTTYMLIKNLVKSPLSDAFLLNTGGGWNGGGIRMVVANSTLSDTLNINNTTTNPASVARYRNGTLLTGTPAVLNNTEKSICYTMNNGTTLNGQYQLGCNRTDSSGGYHGYVAELIICPTVHDINTRQRVEGYLHHKWGIQSELPSNHPYKNSPPTK
jgi:hypothetical protein